MAENTKVTKKDYFRTVRGIVEAAALEPENKDNILAFIDREIELLEKKSSKSRETKTQKANVVIMDTIVAELANFEKPATVGELMAVESLTSYEEETKEGVKTIPMTNQKLSSMLSKLVKEGRVVRTEDKKKAYFSLPAADAE